MRPGICGLPPPRCLWIEAMPATCPDLDGVGAEPAKWGCTLDSPHNSWTAHAPGPAQSRDDEVGGGGHRGINVGRTPDPDALGWLLSERDPGRRFGRPLDGFV
jgi:hypothetical protein